MAERVEDVRVDPHDAAAERDIRDEAGLTPPVQGACGDIQVCARF
jgi:hypothetical protein